MKTITLQPKIDLKRLTLTGRETATEYMIRCISTNQISSDDKVVIDLAGIELVNQSFMNSALAELIKVISLDNCSIVNNTETMMSRFEMEKANILSNSKKAS